jgi:branched-chain amino acid transport system substrate-binding protein
MRQSRRLLAVIGLAVLAVLVLAACAEEEEGGGAPTPTEPAVETPAEPTTAAEEVLGVTDTEIKLGTHLPLSQTPAAAYAPIGDGMRAFFNYINDTQGGVNGRKITLEICDDHYNPPDTVECVRKMVEQDKVFAIVGGLGESTHLAVYKYLEEQGVPDLFISSGISEWTDPVVRTRFGGNPVYITEGEMLGEYIAQEYNGKKLGLLLQNNEFGWEGGEGILRGIEGSDVQVVATEYYEEVEWDVTAQTQRLKNAGAEVVATYAIPPPAASLVKAAREILNWDVPIIVTGVDATDLFINLAGAENAEGVISVVFGHMVYETDVPGVAKHHEIMEKYGSGVPVDNFTLYGAAIAAILVEGLERAGPNLTRDSLIDALESICGWHADPELDVSFGPVSMSPTDHRPIEIESYMRVEDGKWVSFGDLVDFESTPQCP